MLSILIVDDEELVREGLRKTIDWNKMGFGIVGEASNGRKAIEKIKVLKPDVVITDIYMSQMDGLEMISKAKELYPDTEFVIYTGYSNFDYAKKALENNVFAYITKPVKNHEITSVFEKLKNKIQEKIKVNSALKGYSEYCRENLFADLLHLPEISAETVNNLCLKYNIQLPDKNFFSVICQIDNGLTLSNLHNLHMILTERIDYYLSISQTYILKCKISGTECALLIFTDNYTDYDDLHDTLKNIKADFHRLTGQSLTIGVSGIFRNIAMLQRAYSQSKTALNKKTQLGTNKIIDYVKLNAAETETPALSPDEMSCIIDGIKTRNKSLITDTLNQYFVKINTLNSINIINVKNTIMELAIMIIKSIVKNTYSLQLVFGQTPQPAIDIQAFELLSDIQDYILNFTEKIYEHPEVTLLYNYSHKIRQAVVYIMDNFQRQITADTAAKELFITPSHFMHVFKKETGKTFNEFLTEYRITIAAEMVLSGKYKLHEISELVGYHDARHFSKIFKRSMGVTPSEYASRKE